MHDDQQKMRLLLGFRLYFSLLWICCSSFVFASRSHQYRYLTHPPFTKVPDDVTPALYIEVPRGGGSPEEENDRSKERRNRHRYPSENGDDDSRRRPSQRKKKSTVSSIAQRSVQMTTGIVSGTVKHSGKAAYYLVQPKHCDKEELLGLWRLDQQIGLRPANVRVLDLSPRTVHFSDGDTEKRPYKFTPAKWPVPARIEFVVDGDLLYKAVVHRKLAASNVIKLKGNIYRLVQAGWTGRTVKPQKIGTFVARRRLKVEDHEVDQCDDEYDSQDEESEDEKAVCDETVTDEMVDVSNEDDRDWEEEEEEYYDDEGEWSDAA